MQLRRLTPLGIQSFEAWLSGLRAGETSEAPMHLLQPGATSEALSFSFDVEGCAFADRSEMGIWLARELSAHQGAILYDTGFWSALALAWIDHICPKGTGGRRTSGENARYVLESRRRAYRHLVWASWWAMNTYGDDGRYLLVPSQAAQSSLDFGGGEVMGQIAANQMTTASPSVIQLGRMLYAAPDTGRQRKGSSGKGAGSPRRFVQVLRQLEITYDFSSMPADALAAMLPKEFESRLLVAGAEGLR